MKTRRISLSTAALRVPAVHAIGASLLIMIPVACAGSPSPARQDIEPAFSTLDSRASQLTLVAQLREGQGSEWKHPESGATSPSGSGAVGPGEGKSQQRDAQSPKGTAPDAGAKARPDSGGSASGLQRRPGAAQPETSSKSSPPSTDTRPRPK